MVSKTEGNNNKSTIFDKIYFCFFLLLPFIYTDKLVDPVLIPRQIFLTVFVSITGLLICQGVYAKKFQADFSFLKLSVFLFLLLFLTSIAISIIRSIAVSEGIYMLSKSAIEILFFIVTAFLIIQNKLSVNRLIKAVIVFSGIIIFMALVQLVKLSFSKNDFFEGLLTINATFGHKNLLASVLFLTFPFLLNSVVLNRHWKWASAGLALLMIILVWLIQTKAVIVAFIICLLTFLFLVFKYRKQTTDNRFVKIGLIVFSLLIIVVSIVSIQNKEKFSRLFDKSSSIERLLVWDNTGEMIKDNFVLGVGAGNWQIHFPQYGLDKFPTKEIRDGIRTFQRPHNDFLWVFAEMGIVGVVAYLSVFGVIIYYLIKLLLKYRNEEKERWLYASFLATFLAYFFIAFVDFPLERIEHQILLYLLFSIVIAHYYKNIYVSKGSIGALLKLPIVLILVSIPVLFSFVVSFKRYTGESHTQKLYYYKHKSNWGQMVIEADKATSFYYSMDPMSAPIEWYKGVALFSAENYSAAKTCFEQAYAIHPYNIHVLNNLASCYESIKEHQKAEEYYLKALTISSEFEEARLNLSAVYYNMKEYEKAFETIDKCSIHSNDTKYKTFLPAILNSFLDIELSKINPEKRSKIADIVTVLNKDEIINLYVESKKKSVKFAPYVISTLQQ